MLTRWACRKGEAIESRMVTRRIEAAQKKVEERNFEIRKNLLEYDEVMDEQRKRVYGYRQRFSTVPVMAGLYRFSAAARVDSGGVLDREASSPGPSDGSSWSWTLKTSSTSSARISGRCSSAQPAE
jgi:hypothetical protein